MTYRPSNPAWNLEPDEVAAMVKFIAAAGDGIASLLRRDLMSRSADLDSKDRRSLVQAIGIALLSRDGETDIPSDWMLVSTFSDMSDSVDYLIVAIKPRELDALLAAFEIQPGSDPSFRFRGAKFWQVDLPSSAYSGAAVRRIHITMVGEGGTVPFAAFIAGALQRSRPRMVMIVGMGGGHTKLNWQKVVVSAQIWQGDYGTQTATDFRPDIKPHVGNPWLLRAISFFRPERMNWMQRIDEALGRAQQSDILPQHNSFPAPSASELELKEGLIISGNRKMETGPAKLDEFLEGFRSDALMVEMEGVGLAQVCDDVKVPWMAFRGAADSGEDDRSKQLQLAATVAAATAARLFIEREFVFDDEIEQDGASF